jgi:hypothetical protein
MIFIWKGYGFLVPFIAAAVVAVTTLLLSAIFHPKQPYDVCIGVLAAAVAVWYTGNHFNSPAKNRVMIDKATGQEFLIKPDNSLFFIKMQYWAYIVGATGVFLLIALLFSSK